MPKKVPGLLKAYADTIESEYPELARRLRAQADSIVSDETDAGKKSHPFLVSDVKAFGADAVSKALYMTAYEYKIKGQTSLAIRMLKQIEAKPPNAYAPVNRLLARLYEVQDERELALSHFLRAAELGCVSSQYYFVNAPYRWQYSTLPSYKELGDRFTHENIEEAVTLKWRLDYVEGLRCYQYAAERGDTEAMFRLGQMHEQGLGTTKNAYEALVWYHQALYRFVHEKPDWHKKVKASLHNLAYWQQKALAEKGKDEHLYLQYLMCQTTFVTDPAVLLEIGKIFLEGRGGVPVRLADAKHWLIRAKDAGSAEATTLLEKESNLNHADDIELHWDRQPGSNLEAMVRVAIFSETPDYQERITKKIYDYLFSAKHPDVLLLKDWLTFAGRWGANLSSLIRNEVTRRGLGHRDDLLADLQFLELVSELHEVFRRNDRKSLSDTLFKMAKLCSKGEGKLPRRYDLARQYWQYAARLGHEESALALARFDDKAYGEYAREFGEVGLQFGEIALNAAAWGNVPAGVAMHFGQRVLLDQFSEEPWTQLALGIALVGIFAAQAPVLAGGMLTIGAISQLLKSYGPDATVSYAAWLAGHAARVHAYLKRDCRVPYSSFGEDYDFDETDSEFRSGYRALVELTTEVAAIALRYKWNRYLNPEAYEALDKGADAASDAQAAVSANQAEQVAIPVLKEDLLKEKNYIEEKVIPSIKSEIKTNNELLKSAQSSSEASRYRKRIEKLNKELDLALSWAEYIGEWSDVMVNSVDGWVNVWDQWRFPEVPDDKTGDKLCEQAKKRSQNAFNKNRAESKCSAEYFSPVSDSRVETSVSSHQQSINRREQHLQFVEGANLKMPLSKRGELSSRINDVRKRDTKLADQIKKILRIHGELKDARRALANIGSKYSNKIETLGTLLEKKEQRIAFIIKQVEKLTQRLATLQSDLPRLEQTVKNTEAEYGRLQSEVYQLLKEYRLLKTYYDTLMALMRDHLPERAQRDPYALESLRSYRPTALSPIPYYKDAYSHAPRVSHISELPEPAPMPAPEEMGEPMRGFAEAEAPAAANDAAPAAESSPNGGCVLL